MSLLDASQYQLLASGMAVTLQLFLGSWVMAFTIAVTLVVGLSLIHISEPTRPY